MEPTNRPAVDDDERGSLIDTIILWAGIAALAITVVGIVTAFVMGYANQLG